MPDAHTSVIDPLMICLTLQPTFITASRLGDFNLLLELAGGGLHLAVVVVGVAVAATDWGEGLLITAGTHAAIVHALGTEGAGYCTAGLCEKEKAINMHPR